jgi:hypothetical protein
VVIELRAKRGSINIDASQPQWTKVSLLEAGSEVLLGHETVGLVGVRLQQVLRESIEELTLAGSLDGAVVRGGFGLMEPHCAIYAADDQLTRVIFFQHDDVGVVGKVRLSACEREHWFRTLCSITKDSVQSRHPDLPKTSNKAPFD